MADLLSFMGEHPFLTWCLAWGIWPVCTVLTAPFRCALGAYRLRIRAANIAARGWPTMPLMDADGDIVHPPVKEEAGG